MRVFVTGAFGFIGLALALHLHRRGHQVVAFGHAPRNPAIQGVIPSGMEMVFGDLREVGAALLGAGQVDAIAHLAGGGGLGKVTADPAAAVADNVRGTTRLLEAADRASITRRVFASTIAVYGTHRVPTGPYRETDEVIPDELYGGLKEAAEHAWCALGGGTALRLANVYGTGSGVDHGLAGAVERFARAAASGGDLTIFGEGTQRIDYVHVDDVCRAFEAVLDAESAPSHVNIGGGSPIAIHALASLAIAAGTALGKTPRLVKNPPPEGKVWPDRSLDVALARTSLGWSPQVSYDDGVTALVRMMHG